jgi:hypothetical protein
MVGEADIDLARDLAHEIGMQADGTKDSERADIKSMAGYIEQLLGGFATDQDREAAKALLHPSDPH